MFIDETNGRYWLLNIFTMSYSAAADSAFPALVAIEASKYLKGAGLSTNDAVNRLPLLDVTNTALKKICFKPGRFLCTPSIYRSYTGYCNNVNNPLRGAAYVPLQRLFAPSYADGISTPHVASDGNPLPNPLVVSRQLFSNDEPLHSSISILLPTWALFINNDIFQLSSMKGKFLSFLPCCERTSGDDECLSITTYSEKQFYNQSDHICIPYARTVPSPRENCLLGPREQGNSVSSFLDGSGIYGTTEEKAVSLRSLKNEGTSTSSQSVCQGAMFWSNRWKVLHVSHLYLSFIYCLIKTKCLGSDHANFLPTLTAIHTIWMRQHNNLARKLKILNSNWNDERIYQESRKILIAQIQHVTFSEYLPIVIGVENVDRFSLRLRKVGYFSDYDFEMDPSTLNEYAAAAGLFLYSMLHVTIRLNDNDGRIILEQPLSELYMLDTPSSRPGLHLSKQFTQRLLPTSDGIGFNLAAILLQRGREHGLPSYTKVRKLCGYDPVTTFEDLRSIVQTPDIIALLRKLYKKADRFWYENFMAPSAFSEAQLAEIRKTTMAQIICDTTDNVSVVQPMVFMLPDKFSNSPVSCKTTVIPEMDLSPWIERETAFRQPITEETLRKAIEMGKERIKDVFERHQNFGTSYLQKPQTSISSAYFGHGVPFISDQEVLLRSRTATAMAEAAKLIIRREDVENNEAVLDELNMNVIQELIPEIDVASFIGTVKDPDVRPQAFILHAGNAPGNTRQCNPRPLPCDATSPYRTSSGWCNRLSSPVAGSTFVSFRRLLKPAYSFGEPRMFSKSGALLPSARLVANEMHTSMNIEHPKYSHALMMYGQFIDHDISHTPQSTAPDGTLLECRSCDSYYLESFNCWPIKIPLNDPYFPPELSSGEPRCIPFVRSLIGDLKSGYREQINQVSSYIDGSNIYGSHDCTISELRLYKHGKLKTALEEAWTKPGLPHGFRDPDCKLRAHDCLVAGDIRVNENSALVVPHLVFVREHNRIAHVLHKLNKFWSDEKLFQEARKIVGAVLQHITFNEWLPKVIGLNNMNKYGLNLEAGKYYEGNDFASGYDQFCDATISNEFATAAFRFGHTLVRESFNLMDKNFNNVTSPMLLKHMFFNITPIFAKNQGGVSHILSGMLATPSMACDRHINQDLRNHLFENYSSPYSGMDLPALSIQRGRDHGIPGYNSYREYCGFGRAATFENLTDLMNFDAMQKLKKVYSDVEDIDLFPAILSERPMPGAMIGPTACCLIGEQFQRLRNCDRFWYENKQQENRFSPSEYTAYYLHYMKYDFLTCNLSSLRTVTKTFNISGQLAEIRKVTFARIICSNVEGIRRIQPDVFALPNDNM
ncbi:unnamed protein product [Soboliphyme baturini]|uniref:Chorion peroxidase n=1 Tax=Soboliphyme baturini TaxID=241478 RepID=A0A183IJ39_9BILA|nr:unnamed protein product [Soboliphyme baturini]